MKYKLFVTDFDGTLLRRDRTIAEQTVRAIADYRASGGIFTIATGRMYGSLKKVLRLAGLENADIPVASYQGLMIHNAKTHEVLRSSHLEKDFALAAVLDAEEAGRHIQIYVLDDDGVDRLYVDNETEIIKKYCNVCEIEARAVGKLSDYIKKEIIGTSRTVIKALSMIDENEIDGVREKLRKNYSGMAEVLNSTKSLLEILPPNEGKERAVEFLCQHFGVAIADTVCCGDERNDIGMVKLAGLGCAVKNAHPDLLEVADCVLPSNDEDGIGYALRELVMSKT